MNKFFYLLISHLLMFHLLFTGCAQKFTEVQTNTGSSPEIENVIVDSWEEDDIQQIDEISGDSGQPDSPEEPIQPNNNLDSTDHIIDTPEPSVDNIPEETNSPQEDENLSETDKVNDDEGNQQESEPPKVAEETPLKTAPPQEEEKAPPKQETDVKPVTIPYRIQIDVTNQVVTAFALDDQNEYSKFVRQMICSTGKPSTPTPLGAFPIPDGPYDKGRWGYFSKYNVWAQYFTRIKRGYLFHSIIYSKNNVSTLNINTFHALGTPVSAGCIRLMVEDAKWIYDNIHKGTIVEVVENEKNPALTASLKPGGTPDQPVYQSIPQETPPPVDPGDPVEDDAVENVNPEDNTNEDSTSEDGSDGGNSAEEHMEDTEDTDNTEDDTPDRDSENGTTDD